MKLNRLVVVLAAFAILVPVLSVFAQHKHNAAPSQQMIIFTDPDSMFRYQIEHIRDLGYRAGKLFHITATVTTAVEEPVFAGQYASDAEQRMVREHHPYRTVVKLNLDKPLGPKTIRNVTYFTYGGRSSLAGKRIQLDVMRYTPTTQGLPAVYKVISIKPI